MNWFDHITGKLSPERFARRLIDELGDAGDRRSISFDAAQFQLRFAVDGQEMGFANLRNLYSEYQSLPAKDRDQFFSFATRSLLAAHKPIPEDFDDARYDVLVTVRNRSYFSLPELRNELSRFRDSDSQPLEWPHQTLADQLAVGLVYDLPEAMLMLQASHLNEWGVTFYEVYESAVSNLSEMDATFATIDDHSYVSNSSDHYDASRMILADLVAELEVIGDPVALIPNRDRLIVTGSEDTHGLETAALISQQLIEHPRPISGQAFIQRDAEWSPWLPDTDHPAFTTLKSMALATMLNDYENQQQIIDLSEEDAETSKVVAYRVHESGTRQPPFSYCVWQEDGPYLLPKTDRVCFLRKSEETDHPLVESTNVTWADAIRVVGHLLQEQPDTYPVRYRVLGFPNRQQLSKLAAQ